MHSRYFLLNWLKSLNLSISKIEDLGKGFIICKLLKIIYDDFPIEKSKHFPDTEQDFLLNLNLAKAFLDTKIGKIFFPVEKMCKLKMQDNLEVCQLLYKIYLKNIDTAKNIDLPYKKNIITQNISESKVDLKNNENIVFSLKEENKKSLDKILMLKKICKICEKERNFYYQKLLLIEKYTKNLKDENDVKAIEEILYSEE